MLPPPAPSSQPVVLCPSCAHGIDPHGVDVGRKCVVGGCDCQWTPNDIAASESSSPARLRILPLYHRGQGDPTHYVIIDRCRDIPVGNVKAAADTVREQLRVPALIFAFEVDLPDVAEHLTPDTRCPSEHRVGGRCRLWLDHPDRHETKHYSWTTGAEFEVSTCPGGC